MKRRTLGLLVAALLVAFLLVPEEGAAALPRSIVLVTIDTLRADHLGSYGYPRPSSPFLDRLAREGVVFENAHLRRSRPPPPTPRSSRGSTLPAWRSLERAGVRRRRELQPLAEALRKAGYQTAAVSAVGFLAPMLRGFSAVDLAAGAPAAFYRQAHWW